MPVLLAKSRQSLATPQTRRPAIDFLGIWAAVLGAVAIALAAFVYFADNDAIAAALVLAAVAATIGVALRDSADASSSD
jgi:uncharacterized membrane protein